MSSSEAPPPPELRLEELLTNFELFSIFAEFLHENLSHENLTFWVASENFRKHCPPDAAERRKQALELYNKYFIVGSRDELNLDEEVRERVRSRLTEPTAETFAEAQQHVTDLLNNDCFPKFTRSPFYVRYQQQYTLKQAQREEIKLRQSQRMTTSARQLQVPTPPLQHPQTLGDTLHPQVAAVLPPSPTGSRRQQLIYSEGVSSTPNVSMSQIQQYQKVPPPSHQYHQVPPLSPSHQYQQVPPLGHASRSPTSAGGSAPAGMSSPSSHMAGGVEKKSNDDPAMSTLMRRVTNAITFGLFKREKEPPLSQLPASRTAQHPQVATMSRRTNQLPNPSASAPSLVPTLPDPGVSAPSPTIRTQLQLSNATSPSSSSTGGSPLSGATSRSPRDQSPARRDSSSTPRFNNSSGTAEAQSSSHSREKRDKDVTVDVKKDKKHKKDKKKEKKEKKEKATKMRHSQRQPPPSPRSAIVAPRIVSISAPHSPAISVPHSPHSSSTTASVASSVMPSPKTPSSVTPGSKKSPRSRHSGKHSVELLPSPRPPPTEQLGPALATVIPASTATTASPSRPRTSSAGDNAAVIPSKSSIVRGSAGSFSSLANRGSISMTQSAVLPASVAKEVLAEMAEIQVSAVSTIPAAPLSHSSAISIPRSHSPQGVRPYSPQPVTQHGAAVTSASTESISRLSSRSPRAQPPIPPAAVPEGKPTVSRLDRIVPLLESPLPAATPPTPPAPVSAVAADVRPLDLNAFVVAPLSPSVSGSSSSKRAKDNTTAVRQSNSSSSSPRDNNKQRIEGSRISVPATSAGGGTGSRSNSVADTVSPRAARDLSNASSQGSSPVHSPGRDSRSSTSSSKARSLSNSTGQALAALSGKPITRTGSKPHLSHLTHSNSSSRDRDSGVLLRTVTSDL